MSAETEKFRREVEELRDGLRSLLSRSDNSWQQAVHSGQSGAAKYIGEAQHRLELAIEALPEVGEAGR